jgi:hypothetical protein
MVKANVALLDLPVPTRSISVTCGGVIEYEMPLILLISLNSTAALIGLLPFAPIDGTAGVVETDTIRLEVPVLVSVLGKNTALPIETLAGPVSCAVTQRTCPTLRAARTPVITISRKVRAPM